MQFLKILTPLVASALLSSATPLAFAQNSGDGVLLEMSQAFRRGDRNRLTQLLPQARDHVLEPWAAYWEIKARLDQVSPVELQAFFARFPGTYQEDRLRNDWLLLLGKRRDWATFAEQHPQYRMLDDPQVRCYALLIEQQKGAPATGKKLPDEVLRSWYAQRDADDGCTLAASELNAAKKVDATDIWRKARLAVEGNRPKAARDAVAIVAPDALDMLGQLQDSPSRFLLSKVTAVSRTRKEIIVLALIKLSASDPDAAASMLDSKWSVQLSPEENHWLWGLMGKQAANRLSPNAMDYFDKVQKNSDLNDDTLGWKVRAALRAGRWKDVQTSIDAMTEEGRKDPAWVYWKARAILALRPGDEQRALAAQLLQSIASARGFYEQLATEELGQRIVTPPKPAAFSPEEKQAARANPGLNRGLYAILMGLRTEGNREWNYSTNLHTPGGMADRDLLAAADFACQREVWDRCINTSERTRTVADFEQRYPMPFREQVLQRTQQIGLDPAYVYGLIRQESRFIMDARSGVGAAGLMQVMPATARWTANKIGLTGFRAEQIADRDTNIAIGTAYLKLALDDLGGSLPMAAAAYNAGPGRPRSWRNGPVLEGAIWAENIPFAETRDYVKKVLANTTAYSALITGQPQSLKGRLGSVGPRDVQLPEVNKDLP